MFRPLHEQNGTFFWWGHDGSSKDGLRDRQEAWVTMWRDMVAEMTNRQGLSNLLFVFGTNQVNYDQVAPPLTYYPGGYHVDVVSIDAYNDNLNLAGDERGYQHYLALVSTGKPFGLSEFGQSFDEDGTGPNASSWDARTLVRRVTDSFPRTAFAVAWYSSVEDGRRYVFALPDVAYARELLRDPLILTKPSIYKF
jgi:mannan endo-1,4-beta-mannosidase